MTSAKPVDVGPLEISASIVLQNRTATASVFFEIERDSSVANGFEWLALDGNLELELPPYKRLSLISAGADQDVRFLVVDRLIVP